MRPERAPLSYQGRVAREKQRIAEFIGTASEGVRAAWEQTRTTRRFALTMSDSIVAWHTKDSKAYGIHVVSAEYTDAEGVVSRIKLTDPDTSVVYREVSVGRYPVLIEKGFFVSIDGVEPFVQDASGKTFVCLLAYSTAAAKGEWPDGWAVGTTEEFNDYAAVAS